MAKQAGGSALVRYGDTVVLCTAVSAGPLPEGDFLPLVVDYREKTYAAGKIPGSVFKREGRPTTKEVLTMRLVDRAIRPLFPKNYRDEVQVMAVVLSADMENDPDILAMIGASAALSISAIPFHCPVGSVRVGIVNDQLVIFPRDEELTRSTLNLVVSATKEGMVMVAGSAQEVPEERLAEAILFGQAAAQELVKMQEALVAQCGVPKVEFAPPAKPASYDFLKEKFGAEFKKVCQATGKVERKKSLDALQARVAESLTGDERFSEEDIKASCEVLEHEAFRSLVMEGRRADGRGLTDIRPISCEVGILPRTHGSALFTRGHTQTLVVATLGTTMDEQRIGIDDLKEELSKKFMLHYNFPPFSVGEVKPIRSPSRRELGHGALAESSLDGVVPGEDEFPYTIRLVSDVLESDSSSSMATVCGGTLAMMDAGVPIKKPVAGIGMGLVKEGDEFRIVTDIIGSEDHHGDMDFKIAGTQRGVTGLQLDLKITHINEEILRIGLEQALVARVNVLREMLVAIRRPRPTLSAYAPRLARLVIDREKIGAVIGPGGRVIRKIQDETGTKVEVEDDGTVTISGSDEAGVEKARKTIQGMTEEVRVGATYTGRVRAIKDFGAFVEILPGQEGLLHVSEISEGYVKNVSEVLHIGDEVPVKVISVDDQGRVKLSRKAALREASRASA